MRDLIRLLGNKRFRQVFSMFILFIGQFWWLNKTKKIYSQEELDSKYKHLYSKQAKMFTRTAIELGGLLIKLGQFFSSRVDILPQEYTDELAVLQDSVEPVNSEIIKARITEELNAPLSLAYSYFDEQPLAAASLGQVHRARLHSGEPVAVKVLRPGIEDIVAVDLETLKMMIAFLKRYPRLSSSVDLDQVYAEFRLTVNDELNYLKEAENAETFKEIFRSDHHIYVPYVYRKYSTKRLLTLEFMEGFKINDFQLLTEAGVDRKEIAANLLSCYLKQVLTEGFFHADPHPGNLLVRADGTLILLDFGMVGRVNQTMKESMVDLAVALFKKDAGGVVAAFEKLEFLRPHADRNTIKKSVRLMLANLYGETLDLNKLDLNELTLELRELVYSQPFQMPAQTTFLGKALITVFGLCNGLDRDFDLMAAVSPYIKEVFSPQTEEKGNNFLTEQLKKTLRDTISIPEKLIQFIEGVESGEVRLHPARSFEQQLLTQQTIQTNRIVKAVLASGFAITGAQLLLQYYVLGASLLAIGGILALTLLRRNSSGRSTAVRRKMGSMGSGVKKPRLHP